MASDEEQYAACIRFYLLVHIDQDQRPRGASTEVIPTTAIYNWWIEEEEEADINTNTRLHFAEITICMLTRSGCFIPQLSQLLVDMYNQDILPAMLQWEDKAFLNAEEWYTGDERRDDTIPPASLNLTHKLTALSLSTPVPVPGGLHVALVPSKQIEELRCYTASDYVIKPSRVVLPRQIRPREIIFSLSSPDGLPVSSHPVEIMFKYLGARGAIDLLSCALCEKKILLHSFTPSKLPVISEALRCLLFPLRWTHVYVPIVPMDLLNLVEAPVPFILGVDSKLLLEDETNGGLSEEFLRNHDVVLGDCDSGVVSQAGGWGVSMAVGKYLSDQNSKSGKHINVVEKESTHLPPLVDRWLMMACKTILHDNKSSSGSFGPWGRTSAALQAVIFDAIAMLLHRIDDCLFFLDSKTPVFNRPLFLSEYCHRENRPFLAAVTDTNSFHLLTASMCGTSSQIFFKRVIKSLCAQESEHEHLRRESSSGSVGFDQDSDGVSHSFFDLYPSWLQTPKTLNAENVDSFISMALKYRLERYCELRSTNDVDDSAGDNSNDEGKMFGYSGEYLVTKDVTEVPILRIPFETPGASPDNDRRILTPKEEEENRRAQAEEDETETLLALETEESERTDIASSSSAETPPNTPPLTGPDEQKIGTPKFSPTSESSVDALPREEGVFLKFKLHGGSSVAPGFVHDGNHVRHMHIADLQTQVEGINEVNCSSILKSIEEQHPALHNSGILDKPPRFMGGVMVATEAEEINRNNNSDLFDEEDPRSHPDHGKVEPHLLVRTLYVNVEITLGEKYAYNTSGHFVGGEHP